MTLPDCLTTDEFGAIRLTGTRIALSQLMWYYNEGYSAEALQEQFPTLGFGQIHQVLAFYWDNKADVDAYLKQAETTMAENAAKGTKIDLEALRKRLNSRKAS